jgi:hypothetical protein
MPIGQNDTKAFVKVSWGVKSVIFKLPPETGISVHFCHKLKSLNPCLNDMVGQVCQCTMKKAQFLADFFVRIPLLNKKLYICTLLKGVKQNERR